MTVDEVTRIYERVVGQVLNSNLKEAFSGLGFLIQLNGFGQAYDQLTEMENNYRYMLRYRLEGYPDPEREVVSVNIRRGVLELTDEAFHLWMVKNSSDYYYDRIRIDRISDAETLPQLLQNLRQSGEKLTMIGLHEDADYKTMQRQQELRYRERTAVRFFVKLWVSGLWKEADRLFMTDVFNDAEVLDYEKSLFVSALLLALQKRMDMEKMLLLVELCKHDQPEVSQRALVALVLSMFFYDGRIELYPLVVRRLAAEMENPVRYESLIRVFYQLIRSKDTETVTKRMQEEILPEMTKFGASIQEKLRNGDGDDASAEHNPDWKNMMDNAELSVKMQEFSDMQLEGVDVYMSTFSSQKVYPFFQEMSNWFLPFYAAHTSLSDLSEISSKEGIGILDAVLKSDYLCSSDKYSFCFNILQIPASFRNSMATQFGADSEVYEELKKSEMGLSARFKLEQTSNRYIQDLYRFFHLFSKKRDFMNVFTLPFDFHRTNSFGDYLNSEEALRRIGFLYFKNNHFQQAMDVLEALLVFNPTDAELHQKRGYCLQQLGQKEQALEAYLQADLVEPGSLWTWKRIAACYRQLKMPEKALEYYRRAEALDSGKMVLTMNIGHCLVEAGDYVEALKYYFKAEVLSEESPKTWRPIAWCSFMCKKYDQAAKYYEKIMQFNPGIEDYMNVGHLEWCKGVPKKAIEWYKRGIRATHTVIPEFMDLWKKDVDELIRHGVNPDEVPLVRDELLYELEE